MQNFEELKKEQVITQTLESAKNLPIKEKIELIKSLAADVAISCTRDHRLNMMVEGITSGNHMGVSVDLVVHGFGANPLAIKKNVGNRDVLNKIMEHRKRQEAMEKEIIQLGEFRRSISQKESELIGELKISETGLNSSKQDECKADCCITKTFAPASMYMMSEALCKKQDQPKNDN